jgi:hypothetical protein
MAVNLARDLGCDWSREKASRVRLWRFWHHHGDQMGIYTQQQKETEAITLNTTNIMTMDGPIMPKYLDEVDPKYVTIR